MMDLPPLALIGVVHLPALPGSPAGLLSMEEIIERAVTDGRALKEAGFDAIMVENFGDAPFRKDSLPSASTAALAVAADHLCRAVALPIGINALRNDARAALGVAAVVGATFIRVNVHVGAAATDQGILEGSAWDTLTYRKQLGRRIAILADVHVKHAQPLHQPDIALAAKDVAYRGLADGLIVTGPATGQAVELDDLRRVREAVPDRRLFVGSGATAENVASLFRNADGVIVGTALKVDRITANPVDARLAQSFVKAARNREAS